LSALGGRWAGRPNRGEQPAVDEAATFGPVDPVLSRSTLAGQTRWYASRHDGPQAPTRTTSYWSALGDSLAKPELARKFHDNAVRSLPEERAAEIAARTLALPDAQSVEDLTALLTSAGER
jgi:hypothetical protein